MGNRSVVEMYRTRADRLRGPAIDPYNVSYIVDFRGQPYWNMNGTLKLAELHPSDRKWFSEIENYLFACGVSGDPRSPVPERRTFVGVEGLETTWRNQAIEDRFQLSLFNRTESEVVLPNKTKMIGRQNNTFEIFPRVQSAAD